MSEHAKQNDLPRSSPLHVFVFVVVFGPPFGAVALFLVLAIEAILKDMSGGVAGVVGFLVFMVMFSYFFGGLQAILAGFVLAIISRPDGTFTYGQAMFVATAIGSAVGIFLLDGKDFPVEFALVLIGNGIFAALAIRALFAKRFRPNNA